jgi:hypothetical protein
MSERISRPTDRFQVFIRSQRLCGSLKITLEATDEGAVYLASIPDLFYGKSWGEDRLANDQCACIPNPGQAHLA